MDVSRDFYVALHVVYGFATKGRNGSIKETKKLDEARSILVTRFSDLVKELNRARSERDDLRELASIKTAEVDSLRRPIDEHTKPLHAEIESLKLGLEEMGKRANAEHIARLNADGAAKRANEQASGLLTRIADQKAEIERLKVSLDSQSRLTSLETNRADTEHIKHQNASKAAQEAIGQRNEQRRMKENNAAELAELKRDATKQVEHLQRELEECKRHRHELASRQMSSIDGEIQKARSEAERLRQQLAEARTSYERLAQELTKTKADLITERLQPEEAKSKTERALALAKDWERIATDRFDDITRLNRRIAHLETELSELANDAEGRRGLSYELEVANAEIQELRAKWETARGKLVTEDDAEKRRERAKDMVDDIMEAAAVRGVLRAQDSEKVDARPERHPEATVAPPAHGKVWVLLKGREDVVTFDGDERCLGTYAEALKSGQPFTYIESGGSQHLIPVAKIEALSFRPDESMKVQTP